MNKTLARGLVLALVAAPVLAQWPLYRGNPGLQGVAKGKLTVKPELLWTYETGGAITASPVVAHGLVYIGSDDAHLHAVDLKTGKRRWAFQTGDMIEAPALVHEDRVYVGSNDTFFYAIDAKTGDLAWKAQTGDKILGSANFVPMKDGTTRIVVGSYDYKLYCFDSKSGEELWTYETTNYVNGMPAVLGDQIVFGGCDCVLHVVSATTGEAATKIELGNECNVAGSVALAGNFAYFGHYGNAFVCVDLGSGETVWTYESRRHAFLSSPAIGDDRIVFGGQDRKMHCASRTDGTPLWAFRTKRKIDGSPVICDGKVVFGSGDGRLYLVSLADGKELWQYEIGQSIASSPAISNGVILVGSRDRAAFRAPARVAARASVRSRRLLRVLARAGDRGRRAVVERTPRDRRGAAADRDARAARVDHAAPSRADRHLGARARGCDRRRRYADHAQRRRCARSRRSCARAPGEREGRRRRGDDADRAYRGRPGLRSRGRAGVPGGAAMNLPNKITLGRFAFALALFGYLVYTDTCSGPSPVAPLIAASAFVLAVATDALDGYYARKLGQQTDFGRIADPVVDKVIVCGMFIFLTSVAWARPMVPVWMVVVIVTREFMVSGLRGFIEARGVAFPARWDGKLKMVIQCVAVPAVLVHRAIDLGWPDQTALVSAISFIVVVSVWLTFITTVVSGVRYVLAAAGVLRREGDGAQVAG